MGRATTIIDRRPVGTMKWYLKEGLNRLKDHRRMYHPFCHTVKNRFWRSAKTRQQVMNCLLLSEPSEALQMAQRLLGVAHTTDQSLTPQEIQAIQNMYKERFKKNPVIKKFFKRMVDIAARICNEHLQS